MAEYKTPLSRGDTAWFIRDDAVTSLPVDRITIEEARLPLSDRFTLTRLYGFQLLKRSGRPGGEMVLAGWLDLPVEVCFASKAELLASL